MDWYNSLLRLIKPRWLWVVASFPGCVPTASLPGSLDAECQEPPPWLASKEPCGGESRSLPCEGPPLTHRPAWPRAGHWLVPERKCVCRGCLQHPRGLSPGSRTAFRIHGSENPRSQWGAFASTCASCLRVSIIASDLLLEALGVRQVSEF